MKQKKKKNETQTRNNNKKTKTKPKTINGERHKKNDNYNTRGRSPSMPTAKLHIGMPTSCIILKKKIHNLKQQFRQNE
jgi:hypothetical protein